MALHMTARREGDCEGIYLYKLSDVKYNDKIKKWKVDTGKI